MMSQQVRADLDRIRKPHAGGHTCLDGVWYNPNAGSTGGCSTLRAIDRIREGVTALSTRIHTAAHDDDKMQAVAVAMLGGTPYEELPEEVRAGWLYLARLGTEKLSELLEEQP